MAASKKWAVRICHWLLSLLLLVICAFAADHVGDLIGWMIGASRSPIAQAIAPLIFGLLAVIGVNASLQAKARLGVRALWRGIFVAILVIIFCRSCFFAIKFGTIARNGPYNTMEALLGPAWHNVDSETAGALYAFRVRARLSGVSLKEFEPFMTDVVAPILADDNPKKLERLKPILAEMEAAMPPPEKEKDEGKEKGGSETKSKESAKHTGNE